MRMTMKPLIAAALLSLAMAAGCGAANAGACVTGTLASYEALGATGCTIGNMTFFDFSWTHTATNGAGAPSDTIEIAKPHGFGFDFDGLLYATGPGTQADAILQYTVKTTDGANTIDKATLIADGTGTANDIVHEALCAGGLLTACPAGGNHKLDVTGNGVADSVSFPGVNEVDVWKDISTIGSSSATETLSSVTNVVDQPVPEPTSLAILVVSLLGLVAFARFRS
jgi:hypothetical protein